MKLSAIRRSPLLWLTVIAIVVSILPYALTIQRLPAGWRLSGVSPLAPADTTVYYSYIEQGRQGHSIMSDLFTSERYAPTLWQPLWFIVGQVANILHISTPWAYALARTLSIPVLAGALWWLTGWLWKKIAQRVVATSLALFGGGLGSLIHAIWPHTVDHLGYTSIDQWVSEAFPSLSLLGSAHFLLITAGIIFTLVSVERSWEDNTWKRMPWAMLSAVGVISLHPFHALTWLALAAAMTVAHWFIQKKFPAGYVYRWLAVFLIISPVLAWYAWQLRVDPVTIGRAAQNINMSPALWRTLLGLGLIFPLALLGLTQVDRRNREWLWVIMWALVTLTAMYFPLSFQRRLSQGLFIPWALLAAPGVMWLWSTRKRLVQWGTIILGGGLALSTLILATIAFPQAGNKQVNGKTSEIYYLTPDAQQAVRFLRNNTNAEGPLLGTVFTSNALAGLAGHRAVVGHPVETLHFLPKFREMLAMYTTMTESQQRDYLAKYEVCYIYEGPQERSAGPMFHPEQWPDLATIWTSPTITIYQTPACELRR